MAAPTINQAFEIKFQRDTHLIYQQGGSKFRGLCRTDGSVKAETCRFYKLDTVSTSGKTRQGDIAVSNPTHSYATATMDDQYVALLVDELDLTKLNSNVRESYAKAVANAFGRKTDEQIIDGMETGATQTLGDYGSSDDDNFTLNLTLRANRTLDANNVPRDGRRFCAVTPHQWAWLMKIDQFVRSDYTGPDLQFTKTGEPMKTWNGINWFCSTLLPGVGTATAKSYLWHHDAVGHGINSEIKVQWDWENLKQAWSCAGSSSMGAVVIDPTGLVEIRVDDTTALT